ncbi:MAG: alkaline phosphatase D family protein [Pirellulaceae bacterium]|nr:alkaline phosphatase D family protein [Pirellulaceae bacterium]
MVKFKSSLAQITVALFCLVVIPHMFGQQLVHHGQGEMAGEVTDSTVILQSRLTQEHQLVDGDLVGSPGIARFELASEENFRDFRPTDWMEATADDDYIIKTKVDGLKPGTRYFYRLRYGANKQDAQLGQTCSFETLDGSDKSSSVSFVVVTGMNYAFFHHGTDGHGRRMYTGTDKHLGYPALATILQMKPNFFVGTGDNVYYDQPRSPRARKQSELRQKWHQQFVQPRFIELFSQVPTYWEKDDHDYRFNDSDSHSPVRGSHQTAKDRTNPELAQLPSNRLGIRTFWEQVPVVDPREKKPVTYRTYRVNRELQIWLTEGRDYRSPNEASDGPEKTLWGKQQIAWLQRTLLESDATFKILISPTPLIGPDHADKRDSHANIGGFQHEAGEFFTWLTKHGFLNKHFYLVCGDRHWQYHAVHPSGFEEFSCGAICDANAFKSISPGQRDSTDPDGKITHKYTQSGQSGGFLRVGITPPGESGSGRAEFSFYDERGELLYREKKTAKSL